MSSHQLSPLFENYFVNVVLKINVDIHFPLDQIKDQLKSRPLRSLVGLGHYFLLHDKDKDGFWRADELQAVLRTFRIKLSHQVIADIYHLLSVLCICPSLHIAILRHY